VLYLEVDLKFFEPGFFIYSIIHGMNTFTMCKAYCPLWGLETVFYLKVELDQEMYHFYDMKYRGTQVHSYATVVIPP